jgi:hypothetical protein
VSGQAQIPHPLFMTEPQLVGTAARPLATVVVNHNDLSKSEQAIKFCPAIYQEVIKGTTHIRANCFGEAVHSILIESSWLDWRRDLSVPFSPYKLGSDIEERLVYLLKNLELRMGIMDLMIDDSGDVIWLELNTQGQFLFGEALSGYDLTTPFADFLIDLVAAEPKVRY